MESKTTKQRIIKTSSTKSVTPVEQKNTEKLVLKPETVVEVKSNKGKKATPEVAPKQEQSVESSTKQVQVAGKGSKSKVVEAVKETAAKQVKETAAKQVKETSAKSVKGTAAKSVKETATKNSKVVKGAKKETKETKETKESKTEKLVKDDVEDNEEPESGKLRYFKLYYNNDICGRYCGKKPKQAANKAFSSIIKDMKKTDKKEGINVDISFSIKECTRNSSHKEYKYIGKRLLLSTPVKVKIENDDGSTKEIVYKFHNELKKAPKV